MTERTSAARPTPLLERCIPHERTRLAFAFLAPTLMTFAIFWIAATFGEVGGYTGESACRPLLAVAVLFFGQMPIWSFSFRTLYPTGAVITLLEIAAAVLAGLFALLMFSRDWL